MKNYKQSEIAFAIESMAALSLMGFVLDVSKLDTTALGIGTAPTREEIGMRRRFRKIKHRIADTSQFNTRSRGIINKGFVLNA